MVVYNSSPRKLIQHLLISSLSLQQEGNTSLPTDAGLGHETGWHLGVNGKDISAPWLWTQLWWETCETNLSEFLDLLGKTHSSTINWVHHLVTAQLQVKLASGLLRSDSHPECKWHYQEQIMKFKGTLLNYLHIFKCQQTELSLYCHYGKWFYKIIVIWRHMGFFLCSL